MTVFESTEMARSAALPVMEAAKIQRVETHEDLSRIAAQWRVLQTNGLATPYQTFDWVRAWADAFSESSGFKPLAVTCHDSRGRMVALLPLCVQTRNGVTSAHFIGGKHANMNMGLFDMSAMHGLSAADLRFVLRVAADRHAIDFFHFENQPRLWDRRDNPLLLLPHQASASSAWKTALQPDGDAMIQSLMSSESRKKLRHKERKLGEVGAVTYHEARNAAEAEAVLAAFYTQKADRFRAMGIADPFADREVRAFLHAGATTGLSEGTQAISLHAMRVGERIVSVFGGAIHQGRYTGMFTSFDGDPAVSRFSPGDLLLLNLIRMMCARGLTTFDLGTGDARYKTDYCSVEEPLFDSVLPITIKGRMAATGLRLAVGLKRSIKQSAFANSLVSRFRSRRAG